MTERERYIATLSHREHDRVPFIPGDGRRSTLAAWHQQGLPAGVNDYHAYVRQVIGIEPAKTKPQVSPGVNFLMVPQFEEKVVEVRGDTQVVQDWKGNICEISKKYDTSYLRSPMDFVTRTWIKCPVETRADWPDMARRYDAADASRFPADFAERAAQLRERDYVSGLIFPGPFWQMREWCGFEGLCMLFLDDPDFVREMIRLWERFVARMLRKTFERYVPDYVLIGEDMAYKTKPMIGPEMCRKFLLPTWRTWGEVCREAGVPIYDVDSDGYVGSLIPVWIEAGLNCNCPQEVAAGNDLPAYRKQFGTRMAYRGGVDKRAMAKGGQTIHAEIARLKSAIDAGGYIPSCDHGIPADVSWPNFVEYCRLLAKVTGWL